MPRRVLIAEDNETIRKLVRSQMEELPGLEVCATVANGLEAIKAALVLRPDLLILDIFMPKLNGIQAAGVLKKSLPGAKLILFTLFSDVISSQIITALDARLVSKTDGLRALGRAVQELLSNRARELDEGLSHAIRDRAIDSAHLDLLTQRFSAPLTHCSRDFKYLWVNDRYANFLRRPVHKIVGRPIVDVVGRNAFDFLRQYFDHALRGRPVSYEAQVEYKSTGHRRIAASYKPTLNRDGSPDGWLAYVEDITPQASYTFSC